VYNYNKVDERIVKELKSILGDTAVIFEDKEALANYASDESGKYYSHMPDAVVKPENAGQISKLLRLAEKEYIPVTPRGAGSGLAGGSVPIHGGIVVSLERMNRILEIDKSNLVAVVEPGVVTNDLCRRVADEGLYYAGYPMSVELCTIGGNVATNAGGSKVIKYGNTGYHVLGVEAVLPTGEIIQFGGKRRKDSSGYELVKLLVGSEGTLCIFTKIFLNLIPLPGKTVDLLVPFASVEKAIRSVPLVIAESRVLPSAVEFMDRLSAQLGVKYNNTSWPFEREAEAFLILQFEGRTERELEDVYERAGEILLDNGALDVFVADNRSNSERIWKIRRNSLEAIRAVDPYAPTGDVVVPSSEIPKLIDYIQQISREYKVRIPIVGHVADGNFHPGLMKPEGMKLDQWKDYSEEILDRIAIKAVELGGAASGEHGIGFIKKRILAQAKQEEINLMKKLKKMFDPSNIMNPGKLFDFD
jgi:glycolate oxidase